MNRGFTLIEAIVYIALLALLMAGAIVTTYEITQSSYLVGARNSVQGEGNFILRKIAWAMSGASGIDASVPQNLFITRYDGVVVHFQLFTGSTPDTLVMAADGNTGPLTTENVTVDAFTVTEIPPSGLAPEGFTATITIDGRDFVTTHYVR